MFFYFLKIIFDISTSKRSKKYKPHSILAKKKKFKFAQNTGTNTVPNILLSIFMDLNYKLEIEYFSARETTSSLDAKNSSFFYFGTRLSMYIKKISNHLKIFLKTLK